MVDNDGSTGIANGIIKNTATGKGLQGVKIEIRNNWNNPSVGAIVNTIYTDSSGWYSVNLPVGNYTITASKSSFITNSANIVVTKNLKPQQNLSLLPIVAGDVYQIILSWGEEPSDLDSHLVGTLSSGKTYHVYFSDVEQIENNKKICWLDTDLTEGYGPETVTLQITNTTPYYYYVYKYAGDGSISTSEAVVKCYSQ